jgi:Family of unknown function (DUF6328)
LQAGARHISRILCRLLRFAVVWATQIRETALRERLGSAQRDLYVATLALAAVAIVLLVGPVAYHRLVFRLHQKEHLIRAANIMAICGLAAVALAISAAVLLVMSYVMPGAAAAVITAVVVLLFAGLWLAVPLARRGRRGW